MRAKKSKKVVVDLPFDEEFGAPGTPERAQSDDEAYAFYTGQVLREARRAARLTQAELARRMGAEKAYIAQLEVGAVIPSVVTFYRLMDAMGVRIELRAVKKGVIEFFTQSG